MIARKMLAQEFDVTLNLCEYFAQEEVGDDYNSDKMLEFVRQQSIRPTSCWINLYDHTRPVGFITGNITESGWSDDRRGHIQAMYIIPSHNNRSNKEILMSAFTEWALNMEADKIIAMGTREISKDYLLDNFKSQGFVEGWWVSKEIR